MERLQGTRAQIFGTTEVIRAALREMLERYTLPIEHVNDRVELEPAEFERVLLGHFMELVDVVEVTFTLEPYTPKDEQVR